MNAVYAAASGLFRRLRAAGIIIFLSGAKRATHLRSILRKIKCSRGVCFRVCLTYIVNYFKD